MIPAEKKVTLVRGLGLSAAVMISAGSMIGSGIYRKPATMAGQLLSPELLILVWVIAGLITLIGALSNAEVAGIIHDTGGQFIYFKKMYGEFLAFIYGWSIFAVIQTGSQAAIAYVFAEYLGYFVKYPQFSDSIQQTAINIPYIGSLYPLADFGTKAAAIICILFLTSVNYIGVVLGGMVQKVVTYIKIISILLLCFFLFIGGTGSFDNISTGFQIPESTMINIFVLMGLALSGAFWAYDGWNNITFVSGEVKNPHRNIPLALIYSTLIVIGIYVLVNIAFLYVLPIQTMAKSPLVAASAAEIILGSAGASIIAIAVIISTFGALNGSLLATARVHYAMAKNKMFFKPIAKIHPKFRTPHISLIIQGLWGSALVMTGSFDKITDYVIFAAWLFYMLGAFGVIILRKKMPEIRRPYRVWGYPITPLIFVAFSLIFLLNSIISDTEDAKLGLLLILIGIPIFIYKKIRQRFEKKEDEVPDDSVE